GNRLTSGAISPRNKPKHRPPSIADYWDARRTQFMDYVDRCVHPTSPPPSMTTCCRLGNHHRTSVPLRIPGKERLQHLGRCIRHLLSYALTCTHQSLVGEHRIHVYPHNIQRNCMLLEPIRQRLCQAPMPKPWPKWVLLIY